MNVAVKEVRGTLTTPVIEINPQILSSGTTIQCAGCFHFVFRKRRDPHGC